jgi:predicted XRE-type DNA-binding protein
MKKNVKSSGNIFSDIGFNKAEAENLKIRSELMIRIEKYIKDSDLTQVEAANNLGIDQPRLSKLLKGRIDLFTIDRLIEMLTNVEISVKLKIAA